MHQFDRTVRSAGAVPDDAALCAAAPRRGDLTNTANRKKRPVYLRRDADRGCCKAAEPSKGIHKNEPQEEAEALLLRSVFYFCILFFAGCNSVFILHRTSVDILCGRSVQNPAHAFVGHRLAARILRLDGDRRAGAAALFKALHNSSQSASAI